MPSQVDLCNKALRRLGEDPIIALDTNTLWGKRCSQALPEVVRTVLSLDVWRSCTKRASLASESTKPLGYTSSYVLPSDCLRLAALKQSQYQDWAIEGNRILTQKAADTDLEIMYVSQVSDPNEYTPTLYEAIALGLAHELSGYSTATTVRQNEVYSLFSIAVATAQNINAKENPVNYLASSSWIDARISSLDKSLYGQYGDQ